VSQAGKALETLERSRDGAQSDVRMIRGAMLGARVETVLNDSAALLPSPPAGVTATALPEDVAPLIESARTIAGELATVGGRLRSVLVERRGELGSLLGEARDLLPEGTRPETDDIVAVAARAAELKGMARDESVRRATEADNLAGELERKRALEEQLRTRRHERDLHAELATELRTDRIVDYLQSEALVALATTGSIHLERLSDGRYRLGYEDDRFHVIDAWNAEERRSVRTLSGGETFLASLALALALAEGVQMLAVTEKHRLESLFLDEGFGTLDSETLKSVVEALERLGQEDRLVGVITHVTALAEEMPVRVEVVKSQHGSALRMAAATEASAAP
jgi:DNA repair protein SbcC/Rad50